MSKSLSYWYPLFVISVVILLDSAGYGIIVPVVPDFVARMSLSSIQVSSLYSLYGLVLLVFPIPCGILADRVDRKTFLYAGLLGKAFALFGFTVVNTYPGLLMVRGLDAIAGTATWTVGLALIADFYPQQTIGSKFGIVMAASQIGAVAGPLFSGPLADWFGDISPPFYLMSLLCLLAAGLVIFISRPESREPTRSPFQEIKTLMSNRQVLSLGLLFIIGASFLGMLEALYPVYLSQSLAFSRTWISIFFASIAGTFVVFIPLFGALFSKYKPRFFIPLGLAVSAFTAPGLVLFTDMLPLISCLILHATGWALCFAPAFPLFTQAITETDSRFGIGFGLSNVFWAAGFMIGPAVGAGLLMFKGIRLPFIFFSIIMLIMILVFILSTAGDEVGLDKEA